MRLLYLDGIPPQEAHVFRKIISTNILLGIRTLITAAARLGFSLLSENMFTATSLLRNITSGDEGLELNQEIAKDVKSIWEDPGIQRAFEESHRYQLPDSTKYFMDNLDRLVAEGYVPTTEDILRCRSKTSGVSEISFRVQDRTYNLVDVGGQRSDRTKWIKCFEDVSAVLYFLSLAEYNLLLSEEPPVNRLKASICLFTEITNSQWFCNAPIILFLNKKDIFKDKIEKNDHPLTCVFPEFTGGANYEEAVEFMKKRLLTIIPEENEAFCHVTCCIDTENIKEVFDLTRECLLQEAFQDSFSFV